MHNKTSTYVLALLMSTGSALTVERNNFDRSVVYGRNARRDIAETHIDPWVYDKVNPNVEWAPLMPREGAPKRSSYTPPLDTPRPGMKGMPDDPVNKIGATAPSQSLVQASEYPVPTNNSPYIAPSYSAKFDGNGQYSPVWVEDFTDSKKFDKGVGGGYDQDSHPYPRNAVAYDVNGGSNPASVVTAGSNLASAATDGLSLVQSTNSPYVAPAYSAKFDGNGQYSPVWVEDFTDSKKFDNGVGGGLD